MVLVRSCSVFLLLSLTTTPPPSPRPLPRRRAKSQTPQRFGTKYRSEQRARRREEARANELQRDVQSARRKNTELQQRLDALEKRHEQVATERDALRRSVREAGQQRADADHRATRATSSNSALRQDLRNARGTLHDLEERRSTLARSLAAAHGQVESLKQQLAALPSGPEAGWQWLRAEDDRIQVNRLVDAGADRLRADEEWRVHRKIKKAFLEAYPDYQRPRPPKLLPKSPLRLVLLGGSAEVGQSCCLVELAGTRILVDCGIKPSESRGLTS